MNELFNVLEKVFNDEIIKGVISNPIQKDVKYRKIRFSKNKKGFLAEKLTEKQAFHETLNFEELKENVAELLTNGYRQGNFRSKEKEYEIKISKKGKVMLTKKSVTTEIKNTAEHNRQKNYIIKEGFIPPLIDMGVFTKEGKVSSPMYDKYRQINRFIELLDDELSSWDKTKPINVIDFGCGKSYLTFIVYYYLTEILKLDAHVVGLDLKEDVIKKCNEAAKKYEYKNLRFFCGDIKDYVAENKPNVVITLHACDTATDFALANAVNWGADMIFSVPCCQHELNSQIKSGDYSILTRYGIVKERISALMTDSIRANLLEYCSYRTQLLEFIDMTHTPKNILIRAVKRKDKINSKKYLDEVKRLTDEFNLEPTLLKLLNIEL